MNPGRRHSDLRPTSFRRPLDGLGLLLALVLALVLTAVILIAPGRRWGPEMWPFYVGTMGVLLWVVVDLWHKLRERPGDADHAPLDVSDIKERRGHPPENL